MAINGYNLSTKPYLRISGSNVETVVEIQLSEGNRYSTNSRSFPGDRTNEPEDVLIQAVLDVLKSELDPSSAIVQAQNKLEQAEQQIAHNKSEQDRLSALANKIDKVVRVMAQDSIMGEKIAYGTTYKELVELFPLVEEGKVYQPGDMFVIEDPEHVELNGEGKHVLIQTNQIFTYKGESIKQLEGGPSQNGLLAVWKWDGTKNDKQTQTSNELETKPVQ
ncbi:hypothetical protein [Streptococcus oralis]|uniref:hypothetical protein n=1 Tax=Streptococcus oralis TaxID=1303 RepID=UPI001CC11F1A|nr:hypothetical protein [Streptococcus oralis]MBZ2085731.1 hypothetical protein [Streptococcus oralis]MBZ2089394.1 hypothetical protein [Streptococcus oralis]DAJ22678.1 MAG TPA: Protein of unknown function (DUF1366) [Siphoviridae sp. ct5pn1]